MVVVGQQIPVSSSFESNLPALRTQLIGRESDLISASDQLLGAHERLLTLTGVGGCGKTTLALQLAADVRAAFPDGVYLVELAPVTDAHLVVPTIAAAVGMLDGPAEQLLAALEAFLRPRVVLLVLDNCEHLVDACAQQVTRLLTACPDLRILATSREPLQIAGERQRRVAPLAIPSPEQGSDAAALRWIPAVQLFIERAQAVEPSFALTDANAAAVGAICVRLDGIPLAIELAAARVRVLTAEQILARMDDWFRLLASTQRSAPTRQQTLKATLDWSYTLLSDDERRLFRQLAVFVAGWPLEAAELLGTEHGAAPDDTLDLLTRLVDKSLVQVDESGTVARYRLLEPLRQYALHQLEESGEEAHARAAHARFYLTLVEQAAPELHGPRQVDWVVRLEDELGNLRAALQWMAEHDAEALLRTTVTLALFWETRGHLREGRRWLELALAASSVAGDTTLRARALIGAGRLAHQQTDFEASEAFHMESLAIARELGDQRGIAMALSELGKAARLRDLDYDRSIALLEESLALCAELNDQGLSAYALLNLGISVWGNNDLARAEDTLEQSLQLYREDGNLRLAAIAQAMLGLVAWRARQFDLAASRFIAALEDHHRIGDWWFIAYDLRGLAAVLIEQDRAEYATRLLGAAQCLGEALGEVHSPIGGNTWGPLSELAQQLLGTEAFERAWASGRSLSRDEALRAAIEAVAASGAGDRPVAPANVIAHPDTLTRREREVALLLARGYSDRQIAEELYIAVSTVGVHVHHILEKLDLRSRFQVGDWVAASGLAPPDLPPPAPDASPTQ